MYTVAEVARRIDHAVLKPTASEAELGAAARMCRARGVGCLCVRPCDTKRAAGWLEGSSVAVATVVGFPHGANRAAVKAREAELALDDGATELDMVMNLGRFFSGDGQAVREDIAAVVDVARARGALVKVILETGWLDPVQIAEACCLARDGGADFVKTATGFGGGGATPDAVAVMLQTVGDTMQVKASGGIRTWQAAVAFLEQGCTRLGIGATESILDGALNSQGEY